MQADWEERNKKAREIHNAAIRAQERAVKDYWLTFDAYKKTQARIRFRCDYEDIREVSKTSFSKLV